MQWNLSTAPSNWTVRASTVAVFFLLGCSVAFWVAHWPGPVARSSAPLADGVTDCTSCTSGSTVARVLGAQSLPTATAAQPLQLAGVIARADGAGMAIISSTGKPARSIAVGGEVQPGLVLQSVRGRQAMLGATLDSPVSQTLELPSVTRN